MSSDEITVEETRHVAHLARLAISDSEAQMYARQLSAILTHARDIAALDISDVEPTRHAVAVKNVTRADEITPSLDRAEVLSAAPRTEANMFSVPKILGED